MFETQYAFIKRRVFKKKRKQEANPRQYQYINEKAKKTFLNLFLYHSYKIQDAARVAGIKYSSAKTILYEHRKSYKQELIQFKLQAINTDPAKCCGYKPIPENYTKLNVITSVGCHSKQHF